MNIITKVIFCGSAGSAAWISTIVGVPNMPLLSKQKVDEIFVPKNIKSIDDIEIYEKRYGCKYQFVHSWGNKSVFSAREFLKYQDQRQDWQSGWSRVLFTKADENKEKCKRKENMIFAWNKVRLRLEPKTL